MAISWTRARDFRVIASIGAFLVCFSATAQEIEPRTYANTPIGIHLLAAGYAWSNGYVLLDPALPIEDLDASLNVLFLRYTRTFALFGDNAKFSTLLPWIKGDWKGSVGGEPSKRKDTGIGDAWIGVDWNFAGAPALTREEFARHEPSTVFGASLRVSMPIGDYDADKVLNLGSNRWSVRAELAASKRLGGWTVEAVGGVRGFTENDDFLGNQKLEQDPLWFVKTHLIYSFNRPGMWLAGGIAYGRGGRTSLDGEAKNTTQENWRLGAVFAYPIHARHGVVLRVLSGINDGAGSDFDTVGIAYQYAWGAGL